MPFEVTKPQRLHPVSLLFSLGAAAKGLLLPVIVLLVWRGSNYDMWLAIFFIPAAIVAVVKYAFYSYRLGEDEMMVREGILTRNERHIPYARIQNVNLIQNPFHRMLGVAEVHLETASGSKPEAILRVLSLASVDTIRERVLRERAAQPELSDVEEKQDGIKNLLELPTRELVTLGLISNRGMAVLAAVFGLLWQFDFWDLDWERFAEHAPQLAERVGVPKQAPGVTTTIVLGIVVVLFGLVLMKLLSIVWAIFRFHGFTLSRRGRDLRARYGLFTRYTATVPGHRIQLLSSRSTPMHRLFRRAGVLAETAGGGAAAEDGEGQSEKHRLWLAPVLAADAVGAFFRDVLPDADLAGAEWQALPRRAMQRIRNRCMVIVSLVAVPAIVFLGWWGLAIAAIGYAWSLVHASMWWKHAAWTITPTAVAYRSGWWTRRTSVVRFAKIQTVSLSSSPFDRRHEMARLQIDTAGAGRVGHRLSIPYLPLEHAAGAHDRLAIEAARRSFRW